jgi:type II secretory pathway pseudopilin PulG
MIGFLVRRLRHARSRQGGFTLIEVMVALLILMIVSLSLVGLFLGAVRATQGLRLQQNGEFVADSAMEQVHRYKPQTIVAGRDATDATTQWSAAPSKVTSELGSMPLADDASASTGSGASAELPTTTQTVLYDGESYHVNYYVGVDAQASGDTSPGPAPDCETYAKANLVDVVVAVSWQPQTGPPQYFTVSTLIDPNKAVEPEFDTTSFNGGTSETNPPVVMVPTLASTIYKTPITVSPLASDSGSLALSGVTITSGPSNGTQTVSGNSVTYTPNTGFEGKDTLTYSTTDSAGKTWYSSIQVYVYPQAQNYSVTAYSGLAATFNVLASGGDWTTSTLAVSSAPSHGTATVSSGQITYTSSTTYSGTDQFSYSVTDVNTGQSYTGTVTVDVLPWAGPIQVTTPATSPAQPVAITTVGNANGSGLTASIVTQPANGTVTAAGTTLTYTPPAGYSGTTTFTYEVTDSGGQVSSPGTVTVDVTPVAYNVSETMTAATTASTVSFLVTTGDLGSSLTASAVGTPSPNEGTASVSGSTVSYKEPTNWSGIVTFTYTIKDSSGQTATATVTVKIYPVANPLTLTVDSGTTGTVTVAGIGTGLTVNSVGTAAHGTAAKASTTTLSYLAGASYTGSDSFTYTLVDSSGLVSAAGTVTVTVNAKPVAKNYTLTTTNKDGALTAVLTGCTGTGITETSHSTPSKGSVAYVTTGNGTFTYTGNTSGTKKYAGSDSFTYTITDAAGQTSTATITVSGT